MLYWYKRTNTDAPRQPLQRSQPEQGSHTLAYTGLPAVLVQKFSCFTGTKVRPLALAAGGRLAYVRLYWLLRQNSVYLFYWYKSTIVCVRSQRGRLAYARIYRRSVYQWLFWLYLHKSTTTDAARRVAGHTGAQLTSCFTGTKVQILTLRAASQVTTSRLSVAEAPSEEPLGLGAILAATELQQSCSRAATGAV